MREKRHLAVSVFISILVFSVFFCVHSAYADAGRSLNKTSVSLKAGQTCKLSLSGAKKKEIKWTSSDKSIASVKNGVVSARKTGTCKITAKYKNKKYRCSVKVVKDTGKDENLSLTVKSFDSESQVLNLHIVNKGKETSSLGEAFILEVFRDGKWVNVEFFEGTEFQLIALLLGPNESYSPSIHLSRYCDKLEPGRYRFSYDLGARGLLSAEFWAK